MNARTPRRQERQKTRKKTCLCILGVLASWRSSSSSLKLNEHLHAAGAKSTTRKELARRLISSRCLQPHLRHAELAELLDRQHRHLPPQPLVAILLRDEHVVNVPE